MTLETRSQIIIFDNFLNSRQCAETIEYAKTTANAQKAQIGGEASKGVVDENVRKNNLYNISNNYSTAAAMTGAALNINHEIYKFNITHAHQTDLLEYESGGKFNPHIDTFFVSNTPDMRKLTTLVILNDEYEGGELTVYGENSEVKLTRKNKGTLIIFPSFMMHGVTPVTSGIRYSMVNWLLGPSFV